MKVFIFTDNESVEELEKPDHSTQVLVDMVSLETKKPNTEYVLLIGSGGVCIFRVDCGETPRLFAGSMLAQIKRGSLKIGFVDFQDRDIVNSIYNVIQNFWRIVSEEANAECSVVYSPIEKITNFQ